MQMVSFKGSEKEPNIKYLNLTAAMKVKQFHQSFPMYSETPLVIRTANAKSWGIDELYIKDESFRFGLNAFKVLGGSYAIGNYIADRLRIPLKDLTFQDMVSEKTRSILGNLTFVTATDGNHGRGVAWMAKLLRQKAVVYMPKGTSPERLANIQAEGAFACITESTFDECVKLAKEKSEKNGWIVVQDTAWEDYTLIPRWIMQGYTTMLLETYTQMPKRPTHIFVQAGVGSLAAAVTGFFESEYDYEKPSIIIVEPDGANCIFTSAKIGDGKRHTLAGSMDTIMVGLACGEPCSISWDILNYYADYAISCSDEVARRGMKLLANPEGADNKVISGESGAVGFGCVAELLTNPTLADVKEKLGLNHQSVVLTFSTEGATDMESYRSIVGE